MVSKDGFNMNLWSSQAPLTNENPGPQVRWFPLPSSGEATLMIWEVNKMRSLTLVDLRKISSCSNVGPFDPAATKLNITCNDEGDATKLESFWASLNKNWFAKSKQKWCWDLIWGFDFAELFFVTFLFFFFLTKLRRPPLWIGKQSFLIVSLNNSWIWSFFVS